LGSFNYKPSYFSNRFLAIALMILGSVLISFNGLVIRYIDSAENWTVIFYRGCAFSAAIFSFLIFKYRGETATVANRIGSYGWLAGLILATSNICFILSITTTTVANTVFTISLIPFLTALLALIFLGEKLRWITIWTMILALLGVLIMFYGSLQTGEIWGNVLALFTAFAFSIFTLILRSKKEVDMLPCLLLSGLLASLVALFTSKGSLYISFHDLLLCFLLGGIMSGFVNCCFVFATRHLIAAEATLFFFIEICLGPIWVWLFTNELISINTLIGGSLILTSLLARALFLYFNPIP